MSLDEEVYKKAAKLFDYGAVNQPYDELGHLYQYEALLLPKEIFDYIVKSDRVLELGVRILRAILSS